MDKNSDLYKFVKESNKIEGILREPKAHEIRASRAFLEVVQVRVSDLEKFVTTIQPEARLRTESGMDVRVGGHIPPRGGPQIRIDLEVLLCRVDKEEHPYSVHLSYETLHPFMDGNGRSGRILWAWQMMNQDIVPGITLGFLHEFYYQTLTFSNERRG